MFPCLHACISADVPEIVQATPADVGDVAPLFDAYRQFYGKAPDVEAARRFLFARLSKEESVLFISRVEASRWSAS